MLRAQGFDGDILNIGLKNAVFAGPNNIATSTAKVAQAHVVRLLAAELGDIGVRVNGINPDGIVKGSGIFSGGWGASRPRPTGSRRRTSASTTPAGPSSRRRSSRSTSRFPSSP